MKKILLLVAVLGITPAYAQKATEQFIPIGRSPGLSDTKTRIGKIDSFDPGRSVLTLTSGTTRTLVEITARTRIWLDRTSLIQPNLRGVPADLQPGRRCEVRFVNPDSREAEWVKVEPAAP
jgi:hypothetical protein